MKLKKGARSMGEGVSVNTEIHRNTPKSTEIHRNTPQGIYLPTEITEFLFINLESQLRLAAEGTGNSLSALLDSHPYHVHTHICLCLRTLGVYIMIVNLTFSHCFNVF